MTSCCFRLGIRFVPVVPRYGGYIEGVDVSSVFATWCLIILYHPDDLTGTWPGYDLPGLCKQISRGNLEPNWTY